MTAKYGRDKNKFMKGSISFGDAYGLGLIASKPAGVNRNEIVQHLGPEAKRIGMAMIRAGYTASKAKSVARKVSKSSKKAKSAAA